MVVFVADPVFRYTADSTVPTIERNVEVKVADGATLGRIDLNRNDVGVSGTALRVVDTLLDNSCTIDFLNSNDSALVRGGVSIMARRKQGRMELQPGDALVLPAHPKFHVLGVTSYSLAVKEGVVARVEPPSSTAVTITISTPSTDDGGESPRLVFQPEERSSDDDIYDKGGSTLPPPSVRRRVAQEESSSDEERMVAVQAVVALARESKKLTRRFKREMAESDRVVPPLSERSRRRGDEALRDDDDDGSEEDDEKPDDEDRAFVEDDLTDDSKPVVNMLLESVHGSLTTAKAIRQHQLIADANTHLVPAELTRLMDVFSGKGLLEPLERLEYKKREDEAALARIRDVKRNFHENKAVDDMASEGGDFYLTPRGQVEKHGVYFQRRVGAALETKAEVLKQLEAAREARIARAQPEVVEDSQAAVVAPSSHKVVVGGKRSWRALAVPDDTFYSLEDPRKRRS